MHFVERVVPLSRSLHQCMDKAVPGQQESDKRRDALRSGAKRPVNVVNVHWRSGHNGHGQMMWRCVAAFSSYHAAVSVCSTLPWSFERNSAEHPRMVRHAEGSLRNAD